MYQKNIIQINQWKYVNTSLQYFHWHSSQSSHRVLHHLGLTSCNISHNLPHIMLFNVENWLFFIIKVKTSFSLPPSETVADCNKKEKKKSVTEVSWQVLEILEIHLAFAVLATFAILLISDNIRQENLKKPAVISHSCFIPSMKFTPFNHYCPGIWSYQCLLEEAFPVVVITLLPKVPLRGAETISWYLWQGRYLKLTCKDWKTIWIKFLICCSIWRYVALKWKFRVLSVRWLSKLSLPVTSECHRTKRMFTVLAIS